nr:truncated VanYD5 [Enterococcus faecium]
MERQNNNENQYGRNRRKDKRRKLFFLQSSMCHARSAHSLCNFWSCVFSERE